MADLTLSSNDGAEPPIAQHRADRGEAPAPEYTGSEACQSKQEDKSDVMGKADDGIQEEQELYALHRFHDAADRFSLPAATPDQSRNFHQVKQSRSDEGAQNALLDELEAEKFSHLDACARAAEVMGPLTGETISFLKDLRSLKKTLENTAKLSQPLRSFPFLTEETRRVLLAQSMTGHHEDIRLLGQRARSLIKDGDRCSVLCQSMSSLHVRNSVSLDTIEGFLEALDMCGLWSVVNRRLRLEVESFEVALRELGVYEHFVE
ncbi:hypothetical protein CLAIMM_12244 [Cladophialophora immunda]|nr:hypothetical protein CLAIMM_12244 [Cladophialophora immunda]